MRIILSLVGINCCKDKPFVKIFHLNPLFTSKRKRCSHFFSHEHTNVYFLSETMFGSHYHLRCCHASCVLVQDENMHSVQRKVVVFDRFMVEMNTLYTEIKAEKKSGVGE